MKKLAFFFLTASVAQAQTALPLTDLSAFKNPSGVWRIVGGVTGSPTSNALTAQSGTGVLLDVPGKTPYQAADNLLTKAEHGDAHLELDFMLPKGSNSGVYLMGRYEVQLYDSWGVQHPKYIDCGAIYQRWDESRGKGREGFEGFPPRLNASRAPGLWQHLTVDFEAPRFENGRKIRNAKFLKVTLNGAVLHENIEVSGPTRAAAFADEAPRGPLMLQGDHGAVAFRNLRLENFGGTGKAPARLSAMTYRYFEGRFDKLPDLAPLKPVRAGTTDRFDVRLADQKSNYVLAFDGTLTAPETADYELTVFGNGTTRVLVDGRDLLPERTSWFTDTVRANTRLTTGDHRLQLVHMKNYGWGFRALGVYLKQAGEKPVALHNAPSLPDPDPAGLIEVEATAEPVVQRSFVMHGGKKINYALNVGDPSGVNYSYDLQQGGVLAVWKGPFLNATDMWHERGESQLAEALGATLTLSGRGPLAALANAAAVFPDSLNDGKTLVYKGYGLDASRIPTFRYQFNGQALTDRLAPFNGGQGLERRLTLAAGGTGPVFCRLAEGGSIAEVAPGLFAVDGQTYYVQPLAGGKPTLRRVGNRQELILEIKPGAGDVAYALIW